MIKHDIRRAFGWTFYMTIIISVFFMFVIMLERNMQEGSVFTIVEDIAYTCEYMLVLAFATVPYAHAFVEDFERKMIYQIVTRGSLLKYVLSKALSIFLSSVLSVTISMLLFVGILRLSGYAWMSDFIVQYYELNGIGFPDLELWWMLDSGYEFLFYLLAGLQLGFLAAIVALASATLSLFIKNKMMITIFPVICLYVMYEYLSGILGYGYGIYQLFDIFQNYTFLGNHFFTRACIETVGIYAVLTMVIYKRIKRMLCHE